MNNKLTLAILMSNVTIMAIETKSGRQLYCLAKTAVRIADGKAVSINIISRIISVNCGISVSHTANKGFTISFSITAIPKNK